VFTHDYQPYSASLRITTTRTESSGINAVWHIDHPIRPKPGLEIWKLASRYHYRRIDPCEKVLAEPFEAIGDAKCRQVKRGDKGTWQQRARTKKQIKLIVTV
jgi:hypothetical protein